MAIASMVGSNGGGEDQVIGALLHDAIEDCVGEVPDIREQIRDRFGEEVLGVVEGCTDADTHPKPPWRERKEAYLAHLRELPDDSPVLLVSLSDKVHNARSVLRDLREHGDALWDRFKGGHAGSLWYYDTLAEIFGEKHPGYLANELRRVVDAMAEEGGVPDGLESFGGG
jgi:(p)ppGpp synthase/HD superfamily hydrolase